MKTSDSIAKIAPALLKAQQGITFASKDATNPHFKSKYADLPAVIDAVKEPLNKAGIVFLQTNSPSEHGHIAITTRLLHESGEWIEDTATCPLPKNDPQGYGSAQTYLRRYSLASAVGLYQDDDDGQAASKPKATHSATDGAFEALTAGQRSKVVDLSDCIKEAWQEGNQEAAFQFWHNRKMDADESTACWSLLPDSKLRSFIKKRTEELKTEKKAA